MADRPAHVCHLMGRSSACPPRHLFCAKHWRMVPRDLAAEVYAAVKERGAHVDATWAPWWRAQAEAEAAVLRKLHADMGEQIDARLARAHGFADKLEARG